MSEEEKAIKRLEEISNNYNLNSDDLHYAKILYYLIINLQKENEQLKKQYCERTDCAGRIGNGKKVEQLEDRINKALEEIEKYLLTEDYCSLKCENLADTFYKLSEILKSKR